MNETKRPHALGLFSGGLDSILAIKIVQEQGVRVTALHFVSPFFGFPEKIEFWKREYGIDVEVVDISEAYVRMMVAGPAHGYGSVINPCVDCKILMLGRAREVLRERGADFLITGEVLGQRPMSQRRDTLNVIRRDAAVRDLLLRPLSARHLDPTPAEIEGLVDRERLLGISGRGRKDQLALAKRFGITEIPTPGGGCRLTEKENARSYWPILKYTPEPRARDFILANTGRQYWHLAPGEQPYRLIIGRNQEDNTRLLELADEDDLLFKTRDTPGPIALGRFIGHQWSPEAVASAAAFAASYSGKAVLAFEQSGSPCAVRVHAGSLDAPGEVVKIRPDRNGDFTWNEYSWLSAQESIRNKKTINV